MYLYIILYHRPAIPKVLLFGALQKSSAWANFIEFAHSSDKKREQKRIEILYNCVGDNWCSPYLCVGFNPFVPQCTQYGTFDQNFNSILRRDPQNSFL